jgi:hypothetical protein
LIHKSKKSIRNEHNHKGKNGYFDRDHVKESKIFKLCALKPSVKYLTSINSGLFEKSRKVTVQKLYIHDKACPKRPIYNAKNNKVNNSSMRKKRGGIHYIVLLKHFFKFNK